MKKKKVEYVPLGQFQRAGEKPHIFIQMPEKEKKTMNEIQAAPTDIEAPRSIAEIKQQVNLIQQLMKEVMKENEHYGQIPGSAKPSLYKAGAEKLNFTFRLDPQYEITEKYEDTPEGRHYTVVSKCTLYHIPSGRRMGSGYGSCTTREKKYAYRQAERKCPKCKKETIIKGKVEFGGGWLCFAKKGGCGAKYADDFLEITSQTVGQVPNTELPDLYNTILKMANKRSLIAADLNVTAASDIFTQDIEDMPQFAEGTHKGPDAAKPTTPIDAEPTPEGEPNANLEDAFKKALSVAGINKIMARLNTEEKKAAAPLYKAALDRLTEKAKEGKGF